MWRKEFTIKSKYATVTGRIKEGTRLLWYVSWYTRIKEGTRLLWYVSWYTRYTLRHKTHINPQTTVVTLFKTEGNPHTHTQHTHTHTHTHAYKIYNNKKTQLPATYRHLSALMKHKKKSASPLSYLSTKKKKKKIR